jgi:hypothetical protein
MEKEEKQRRREADVREVGDKARYKGEEEV